MTKTAVTSAVVLSALLKFTSLVSVSSQPLTARWTWLAGTDITNRQATYGPLGEPSALGDPGGRESVTFELNTVSGNLLMYGGYHDTSECEHLWSR